MAHCWAESDAAKITITVEASDPALILTEREIEKVRNYMREIAPGAFLDALF